MINFFGNVSASQPRGVVDGGSFKLSSLCKEGSRICLTEPLVDVGGVQVYSYLLGDASYPLLTYSYTLTMMQIEHYVSLHQPPLLHLLLYKQEHVGHEIPPRDPFFCGTSCAIGSGMSINRQKL